MSFKWNEEEGPSALGVSLCDRHGVLQMSVIIIIIKRISMHSVQTAMSYLPLLGFDDI